MRLNFGVRRRMKHFDFRVLEAFPEPAFEELAREAFSDFGRESQQLAEVLSAEAALRGNSSKPVTEASLRIGAFRDERLVGWTYARAEAEHDLYMVNSGVARAERREGVYSRLVQLTIQYAASQGYRSIKSRHTPMNNAVIIPKLRLGFQVSGFEYSEVYGPLVCLTYLVGERRRELYQERATPIVPPMAKLDHSQNDARTGPESGRA
jgi:ribosomal protein S18 acetylase RimI-like enzyme